MDSKPFEMRYLIAHAFNAPVRSSFIRKGPEKLCGYETFSGLWRNAGIIFFLSLFMQILGGELLFIPPIQWLPCHTVANLEV